MVTGEKMPRLKFTEVRGLDGVKEASITISPHPDSPLHNGQVGQSRAGQGAGGD